MLVQIFWNKATRAPKAISRQTAPGIRDLSYLPNTTDWLGRWRIADTQANDWGINREWMRDGTHYSGIDNVTLQDQAVTESMGPITDQSFEHLAPSDQMIARTRRRLLRAARALQERNIVPPGVDDPEAYMLARSGNYIIPNETDWQDGYRQQVEASVRPTT